MDVAGRGLEMGHYWNFDIEQGAENVEVAEGSSMGP